jgi:hypothetical protein
VSRVAIFKPHTAGALPGPSPLPLTAPAAGMPAAALGAAR